MSLRLYLDDCAFSKELLRLLRAAGHDVETPVDVRPSLMGAEDAKHFAHARASGRVLLTLNPRDFKVLHDQNSDHYGIAAVYQDNDPRKDMSWREIVMAIANLEATVDSLRGRFFVLNVFRW